MSDSGMTRQLCVTRLDSTRDPCDSWLDSTRALISVTRDSTRTRPSWLVTRLGTRPKWLVNSSAPWIRHWLVHDKCVWGWGLGTPKVWSGPLGALIRPVYVIHFFIFIAFILNPFVCSAQHIILCCVRISWQKFNKFVSIIILSIIYTPVMDGLLSI